MKNLILAIAVFLLQTAFLYSSAPASAGDKGGNGGDEVRKIFFERGNDIVTFLKDTPEGRSIVSGMNLDEKGRAILAATPIKPDRLADHLNIREVKVVPGPIFDNGGSVVDAALGLDKTLRLDQDRWTQDYVLVFHEMLRLDQINDDDFVISKSIEKIDRFQPKDLPPGSVSTHDAPFCDGSDLEDFRDFPLSDIAPGTILRFRKAAPFDTNRIRSRYIGGFRLSFRQGNPFKSHCSIFSRLPGPVSIPAGTQVKVVSEFEEGEGDLNVLDIRQKGVLQLRCDKWRGDVPPGFGTIGYLLDTFSGTIEGCVPKKRVLPAAKELDRPGPVNPLAVSSFSVPRGSDNLSDERIRAGKDRMEHEFQNGDAQLADPFCLKTFLGSAPVFGSGPGINGGKTIMNQIVWEKKALGEEPLDFIKSDMHFFYVGAEARTDSADYRISFRRGREEVESVFISCRSKEVGSCPNCIL